MAKQPPLIVLKKLQRLLSQYTAKQSSDAQVRAAAVAMIIRPSRKSKNPNGDESAQGFDQGIDVLFIKRASHPNDPWSGHIAFPGGKKEHDDLNNRAAAERETLEEIGINLQQLDYLGQLDDVQTLLRQMHNNFVVSCFVYMTHDEINPVMNHEIEDCFWYPLTDLQRPDRQIEYRHLKEVERIFPATSIKNNGQKAILWGITYYFVGNLMAIIGPLNK